jgi:uncharacterized protein YkwD
MKRRAFFAFLATAAVAACATPSVRIGPDGLPLPQVYQMPDDAVVLYNMLDALNAVRGNAGVTSVRLNAQLNAAAATHSRDMALQNRPWHFGSDGSSPLDRARRVGYDGRILGETISETYETEIETLGAWLSQPDTRAVLLDGDVNEMGFAWLQESNGKIWWTLVLGQSAPQFVVPLVTEN